MDNQEIKTKLGVLVLVAVAGIFFGWSLLRLKRVKIDKKYLYVSNYFSEIKVPLKYVDEVSENVWLNHRPIKVKFNISTKFGSSIVFMPKIRWFAFFSFNPMVDEIERAVRIAKRFKPHTK